MALANQIKECTEKRRWPSRLTEKRDMEQKIAKQYQQERWARTGQTSGKLLDEKLWIGADNLKFDV